VTVALQETELAWALADAVEPELSAIERNYVFMAIGAGETFVAIRGLCKSVAEQRISLQPGLVQRCATWLQAYVGHRDERYLRYLIDHYLVPYSIHGPAMARVDRLRRPPTDTRSAVTGCRQRHSSFSPTTSATVPQGDLTKNSPRLSWAASGSASMGSSSVTR
jgi:hypothetical protein